MTTDQVMVCLQVPYGQVYCPADTVKRIHDWAQWARPRLGLDSRGRCASAEGRYESVYPEAVRNIRFEVDLPAVLQVERVVCVKLPKLHKSLIVRHFVKYHVPAAIARDLAVPKARYGDELKRGILMLRNLLTRA